MPDGVDPRPEDDALPIENEDESSLQQQPAQPEPEESPASLSPSTDAPLDGVSHPQESAEETPSPSTSEPASEEKAKPHMNRKKILLLIVAGVGAFLLFYLFFAFYLIASLPSPDGGKQGLKLFGNLFYGGVSLLSLLVLGLFAMRLLRSGTEPAALQRILLRPGIVILFVCGIASMVFLMINKQTPLSIDVLEPQNLQGLTAPITITFGTSSLRSILRRQSLVPRRYKWDFDGDGSADADTVEQEVTTVFKNKGAYTVRLRILLSNGKIRSATTRINIPNVVFSAVPDVPVLGEEVRLSAVNLVTDPEKIENVLWDFDGDGTTDFESTELNTSHTFTEIETYQTKVTIQYQGGLQEEFVRPITVIAERKQPFDVDIAHEGEATGTAPFGIILGASVEEGIQVRSILWTFENVERIGEGKGEEDTGERVSHIFKDPGEYRVILEVRDLQGRTAKAFLNISVLDPLNLRDVVISGTPRPVNNAVEGRAPLEVRLSASTNTPFISFRWEQEGASRVFSTKDTYHAIYEEDGTFPVIAIAEDVEGRTQTFPLDVRVLPPTSRVIFSAIPSTGIAPLSVTFDASQSFVPDERITGFSWIFGDGGRNEKPQLLGAQVSHRYEEEGTYVVTVRALTESGKTYDANKTIVVRSPTLDACVFPSRSIGDAPMGVRFDASCSTGNIVTYLWNFGDGATSEQEEAVYDHVFEAPGSYDVTLEVTNDLGNFSQTSVTITVR